MSRQLNLLATCLVLLLIAGTASASVHTLVMDGELLVAEYDGEVVSTLDLPVEPHAAFGFAGGRVLFTVEQVAPAPNSNVGGGELNLWSADLNADAVQLTTGEAVMSALWSEQLEKVVYWNLSKQVFTVDPEGGEPERMLENAINPALSPDGTELAYVLTPEDWHFDYHCLSFEIHVRNLLTGEDRVLVRGTDASELVWTPDGSNLIFRGVSSNYLTSLWRVDARSGESVQLTNVGLWSAKNPYFVPNYSQSTDVSWSADGRDLLFGASYTDAGEVIVVQFDEQYNVRQALDLTPGRQPFWSENGEVLVPRRVVTDMPLKNGQFVHFAAFPVEPQLAAKVIDVAGAPREFPVPKSFKAQPAEDEIPHKAIDKYRYPIHSSAGHPFTYFYDNGGCVDWHCDSYCSYGHAYSGHKGTDIGVNGWWVYSGAYGTQNSANDGCPSTGYWCSSCGGGFGNYLKLYHGYSGGRNWYTTYAHMRNGSVITGTKSCGVRLGITASSGCSTGPHLHFQVDAWGYQSDDPFSGACSGPVSYWCNQNGGYPTTGCC